MNKEELQKLLERFMDGATTLEEERALADYFRTADVPAEWADHKAMFALWDEGRVWVGEPVPAPRRRPVAWRRFAAAACAAAAAVALVFFAVVPSDAPQPAAVAQAGVAEAPRAGVPAPSAPVAAPLPAPSRRPLPAAAPAPLPDGPGLVPYVEPRPAPLAAPEAGDVCIAAEIVVPEASVEALSPSQRRALRDIARVYAENTYVVTYVGGQPVSETLASLVR